VCSIRHPTLLASPPPAARSAHHQNDHRLRALPCPQTQAVPASDDEEAPAPHAEAKLAADPTLQRTLDELTRRVLAPHAD
jgi:hypothetical protein